MYYNNILTQKHNKSFLLSNFTTYCPPPNNNMIKSKDGVLEAFGGHPERICHDQDNSLKEYFIMLL